MLAILRNCFAYFLSVTLVLNVLPHKVAAQDQRTGPDATLRGYWELTAPWCAKKKPRYPSFIRDSDHCEDGDAMIFNGLLCTSGINEACNAVANSQDVEGRWWRSPRLKDLRSGDFSNDQTFGVLHYLVATKDRDAAIMWDRWLHANSRPCFLDKKLFTLKDSVKVPIYFLGHKIGEISFSYRIPLFGDGCMLRGPASTCPEKTPGPCMLKPRTIYLMEQVWRHLSVPIRVNFLYQNGYFPAIVAVRVFKEVWDNLELIGWSVGGPLAAIALGLVKDRVKKNTEKQVEKNLAPNLVAVSKAERKKFEKKCSVRAYDRILDDTRRLLVALRTDQSLPIAAACNKPGFSVHLPAVEVLLQRRMGLSNPQLTTEALEFLISREPTNPYFKYLKGDDPAGSWALVKHFCRAPNKSGASENPADNAPENRLPYTDLRVQWTWERSMLRSHWPERDGVKVAPWQESYVWECIFLDNLINGSRPFEAGKDFVAPLFGGATITTFN